MAQLKDVAHVTFPGREDQPDGDLATDAWLVHQATLEAAVSCKSRTRVLDGVTGYEWHGNIKQIFRDLFSEQTPPARGRGKESLNAENRHRISVTAWLKRHGNIALLDRSGDARRSTWWIAAEFRSALGVEHASANGSASSSDSSPAQQPSLAPTSTAVTSSDNDTETLYQCQFCAREPFRSPNRMTRHVYEEHIDLPAVVSRAVRELAIELGDMSMHGIDTHVIVRRACNITRFSGITENVVLLVLKTLADDRSSKVQRVKPLNGFTWIESTTVVTPPPPRTHDDDDETLLMCRESSCSGGPFGHPHARRTHEDRCHADSLERVWKCFMPNCEALPYYNQRSLLIHIIRFHNVRATMDRYTALLEQATNHARRLTVSRLQSQPLTQEAAAAEPAPTPAPAPQEPQRADTTFTPTSSYDESDYASSLRNLITDYERVKAEHAGCRERSATLAQLREKLEALETAHSALTARHDALRNSLRSLSGGE